MKHTAFMAAQAKLLLLCLAALCLPAFANVPQGLRLTEKLPLHRGSTALTEGAASETNHYDSFGNRWVTSVRGLVADPLTPAGPAWFSAASNQMTGVPYGAAGNPMQFNSHTLRYDAEGRVVSATSTANGSLAAEYGAGSGESGLEFLTEDHLGSVRLVTGALGNVIRCHDDRPFGQDLSGINGRGPKYGNFENVKRFTGKKRDEETGLDYFGTRYMAAARGRFTRPDPIWIHNPLRFTHPPGMDSEIGKCGIGGARDCFSRRVLISRPARFGCLLDASDSPGA